MDVFFICACFEFDDYRYYRLKAGFNRIKVDLIGAGRQMIRDYPTIHLVMNAEGPFTEGRFWFRARLECF